MTCKIYILVVDNCGFIVPSAHCSTVQDQNLVTGQAAWVCEFKTSTYIPAGIPTYDTMFLKCI